MFKLFKKIFAVFVLAVYFSASLPHAAFSAETLNIIAVGDTGGGNDGQKKVADVLAKVVSEENVSFILLLGDNFYGSGVKSTKDKQWKTKFEDIYHHPSLQIPWYPVLGNHDYKRKPEAQVDYSKISNRWIMPARYYTFTKTLEDGTEVQFFALDIMAIEKRKKKRRKQLAWLEEQLDDSRARWKIVFGHHPVYSGGKHGDMDFLIKHLEPLLIEYKVDLYISGHDHVLEALKPIVGVHYLISGAGSGPTAIQQGERDLFATSQLGFALLRVSKDKIDVELIDAEEEKVLYTYAIHKSQSQNPEEDFTQAMFSPALGEIRPK